jgi:lysophospholipase L1-like esterase
MTRPQDDGHLSVATTQATEGSHFFLLRCNARRLGLLLVLLASPALATEPPIACGSGGAIPAGCGNIVFDGDSISAGVGASSGQHPDTQFVRALGRPVRLWNSAAGGRPVSDCLRQFAANVGPHIAPGARFNLIVFHAGDNDIAQGRDAAVTYNAFTGYVAAAHRPGWKVVVSTELPRPGFPPAREAELDAYNRRLLANRAGADAVVDLSADLGLTDPQDRVASGWYAPDRVHLNDAGYGVMTRRLVTAARPLLPQGPETR